MTYERARLERVYDALLLREPRFWPAEEDRAGGCLWQARQAIAELLHETLQRRTA